MSILNKVIDFRGRTPKKLGLSWSNNGYLALSALNVKNGWIDKNSSESHFGDQELYDKWMGDTPLYKGQVIFTTEAPMGNVAQIPDNNKYILSQRTIAFVPQIEISDDFLASLLSTNKIQLRLKALATGGTAKGVSQKSLKFLQVKFPSKKEQEPIARILNLISNAIDLQQRKVNQLKQLKKAMLQNMFADKDSQKPKWRFSEFNEKWEQRKFRTLVKADKNKNKENLTFPAYSISNQYGFIPQDKQFGQDNTYSKTDKTTNYIVTPHSFAYNPARINVGSIGYQNLKESVLVSSLYEVFKTNSNIDDLFLQEWFKTKQFSDQIIKYQEGGVRQYYFFDKLQISNIKLPFNLTEQVYIAKVLKKLDSIISFQQTKLKQYNKLKKYLLQKLFI